MDACIGTKGAVAASVPSEATAEASVAVPKQTKELAVLFFSRRMVTAATT